MSTRRPPDTPRNPEPLSASAARRSRARKAGVPPVLMPVTPQTRHAMIAERAYLRAERRGFGPGRETEDWLAAEAEVDALLKVSLAGSPQ